tara:strand:+ start:3550 stop:3774 length:225 start_codon:yes stop_codon:yes gene_type:complete
MKNINLKRGIKRLIVCVFLCFAGPVVLSQAFKNEDHPYFLPVLFIGLFTMISAISYGAWGILTITKALLQEKNN